MEHTLKPFIYTRRSQDERNRQVLSLPSQIRELRALGEREGIHIFQVLEESRTAKEPGRPIFNKMLERIERGEANAIFIWDIDRLYRNPVDEGRVRWMLQKGVIREIRTPTRRFLPQDAGLLMGVEGGRATDYIIRLSTNVKRGIREKLLRGEYAGGPKPLGYIYDRRRRNIVPDPKHAPIIRSIFERYATGDYSLKGVSAMLFESGIRSRTGKPFSNWSVDHVLTNRVYEGVLEWNGELFEGKYKLIMPRELFAKVQWVLKDKTKSRKVKTSHDFPLRGLFRCSCGSMITAQFGRGHGGVYRYYRCTRKQIECHEPYIQEKVLVQQIVQLLRPLAISNRAADGILGVIQEEATKEGKTVITTMEQLDEKLVPLQKKLDRLTNAYLDQLIDDETYRSMQGEILSEKNTIKAEIERLQRTATSSWIEPAKDVLNTLQSLAGMELSASLPEIATLVRKIGSNRQISRKTVAFSFAEPFHSVQYSQGFRDICHAENRLKEIDAETERQGWCSVAYHFRTFFTNVSVRERDTA